MLFLGASGTIAAMKIATFNVNGVNGRLPVLLRWLEETSPDVVCLQELKSETFPQSAVRAAGYEAIWSGQKSWNGVAILARGKGLIETRRALPGDEDDLHSRYIEAAVDGLLIGCLYLPNGNPYPSEKFDFKLRWFERLIAHAAELLASGAPIVLAGDYNVMPTELDVYKPERWVNDALFRIEVREAFSRLAAQGWTDALRDASSGRAHLHVLGLFPERLCTRRWLASRPPALESVRRRASSSGRGRPRRARMGESERPCAGLDRTCRRGGAAEANQAGFLAGAQDRGLRLPAVPRPAKVMVELVLADLVGHGQRVPGRR